MQKNNKMVVLGTAAALVLILSGFLFLGSGFWREYRNGIIDKQKEQMLLTTQAISKSMEFYIQDAQSGLEALVQTAHALENADLKMLLSTYLDGQNGAACDVLITDEQNAVVYSQRDSKIEQIYSTAQQRGQQVSQVRLADGRICLALGRQLREDRIIWLLLDLGNYYEKQVAQLHVGTNGYILVKNSDGIILMHPQKEQLGIDVIDGRTELYPEADLTSLEKLVQLQNEGGEGVMEYYSYWWMDPELPLVRKVAAWSPVSVGEDFLVVSAVMDYNDIYIPVAVGMGRLGMIFVAVTLCIVGVVLYLGKTILERRASRAEISDLKRVNRALEDLHRREQSIAHQQRLQMMGTMTGGIAHEFNNLLTPILGHAELLLVDLPEQSELYDSAQEIARSAAHCKEIIRQLSTLSRKNVETVYQLLPAQQVFSGVMKMVRPICPEGVTLEENLQLGETRFLGNETQINQVVLNVCVNAIHAIGAGPGRLRVTGRVAEREELIGQSIVPPSDLWQQYLCLDVEDDGCGMSQVTLAQIFDPFFTTKKSGQGTGLGLSLAAQIIRAHKGDIWAWGVCSTFFFRQPRAERKRETFVEREKPGGCC